MSSWTLGLLRDMGVVQHHGEGLFVSFTVHGWSVELDESVPDGEFYGVAGLVVPHPMRVCRIRNIGSVANG
jgi:hypothetical protein